MVARHIEQFTVSTAEDFSDLEVCLSEGRVESALIEIPERSPVLVSAREFRRVVNLARAGGIDITFSTDDPLRRELARIVGGRVSGAPLLSPEPLPLSEAATRRLDGVTSAPVHEAIATDQPDTELSGSEHKAQQGSFRPFQTPPSPLHVEPLDIEYDQSNPSFSFVVNPPVRNRNGGTAPLVAPAADPLHEVWDNYSPPESVFHRSQRVAPKKRRGVGRTIALLMVLATVLVAGLLVAIVVLPSASIQLTPATQQVSAVVTYGVAQPGQVFDIVIQPEPLNTVVSFEAIIPATGTRTEPDGTAAGTILLTNTSTVDIEVPAGTLLTSNTGVTVVTTEDAVVPAADPFGSLTVGSAAIGARATSAGPAGNIGAESLQGQLDSGVYYSNRDAFTGGTDRVITVVSADDIAALRHQAEVDLNAQAALALESRLLPEQRILDGTKTREPMQFAFDHQAGDDAQVVGVRATLALSAETYRLGDIHEQAHAEVELVLGASAAANTVLLPESITVSAPQPVEGSNGLAFTVQASGVSRSVIDSESLAALEADLVGLSAEQAMARIQQVQGVAGVDVQYERDWFGERMPRLQSRIAIEVLDAAGVSTQATSTGP